LSHPNDFSKIDDPDFLEWIHKQWELWHSDYKLPDEFYVEKEKEEE